jgi:ketosteroid isomerase-like protein
MMMNADTAKALVREYFQKLLNEKDLSVCDRMLSQDYVTSGASLV